MGQRGRPATAPSLSVSVQGDAGVNGGIEAAKAGTTAVLDGEANDITDLGDGAFVVSAR